MLILIAIAQRSMKCPNALAVCVWPSLGWEQQRLPFTSGLLQSSAVNCLSSLDLSICFLAWMPSTAGRGGRFAVLGLRNTAGKTLSESSEEEVSLSSMLASVVAYL